jgi:hypothetical protein
MTIETKVQEQLKGLALATADDLQIRQIAIEYEEAGSIIERGYFRNEENVWLSYVFNKSKETK